MGTVGHSDSCYALYFILAWYGGKLSKSSPLYKIVYTILNKFMLGTYSILNISYSLLLVQMFKIEPIQAKAL